MSAIDVPICTLTLVETSDGKIAVQTKFDPPMTPERMDTPLADAAAVAIGAIGNWAAGLPTE